MGFGGLCWSVRLELMQWICNLILDTSSGEKMWFPQESDEFYFIISGDFRGFFLFVLRFECVDNDWRKLLWGKFFLCFFLLLTLNNSLKIVNCKSFGNIDIVWQRRHMLQHTPNINLKTFFSKINLWFSSDSGFFHYLLKSTISIFQKLPLPIHCISMICLSSLDNGERKK